MADATKGVGVGAAASGTLSLLGTTCCLLPTVLLAMGAGGALLSLREAIPWLGWVARNSSWVFLATGLSLAVSWLLLRRAASCAPEQAKRLRWQRVVLRVSATLLAISLYLSYASIPVGRWLEGLRGGS